MLQKKHREPTVTKHRVPLHRHHLHRVPERQHSGGQVWLASLCNFGDYTVRINHIINYTVTLSNLQLTDRRTLEESETAILGSAAGSLLHQGPDIFSLNDC